MEKPGNPENEAERLAALRELGLLDTPPEERFDRLTRLAQHIFDVKIVLITLIDADRQWFKSRQGLYIHEVERTESFCGHAILNEGILEVPDTLEDMRFHDNPLVVEPPHVRYYAGVPLSAARGLQVGTLCLMDSEPRQFTGKQRHALLDLAASVEAELNFTFEQHLQNPLRSGEPLSQVILNTLPDMVFVVERSGRVVFCQDSLSIQAQGRAELPNVAHESVPSTLVEQYKGAIRLALASKDTVTLEYRAGNPESPSEFEARFKRLSESEALVLIRDVTQEKGGQETLLRQKRVTEAIARSNQYLIQENDQAQAFRSVLQDVLALTGSEHGLLAEVAEAQESEMPFGIFTNPASDQGKAGFRVLAETTSDASISDGLRAISSLVISTGEPAIWNEDSPASLALAHGLKPCLGIPIHYRGRLHAVLGIAHSREPHDRNALDDLQPLLATVGQLISTSRILEDNISKQRQIERLSRVARETTNAVVITDTAGRIEWINESFTRITGYRFNEAIGHTPGELLQGQGTDHDRVLQMREALRAGKPFELDVENYTKNGERFWMHISCDTLRSPSGELQGFMAIESDITRQKEAESRVHQLLEQLKKLTSNLPGMVYQFQLWPDGRTTLPYTSVGLTSIYGISPRGLEKDATPLWEQIHPEDVPRLLQSLHKSAEKLTVWEERFQLEHPSGSSIWVEGRSTPERLSDGSTLWHGFLANIDERVRLEQDQQEQAQQTQAILDNIVDGIVTVNQSGTIVSVNPAAERIFGYSADEVLGQDVQKLIPSLDANQNVAPFGAGLQREAPLKNGTSREVEAVRSDGRTFPMDLAFSSTVRGGSPLYIAIMRDISQRKNAEKAINDLAFYDPLTRLPNRRLFYDRLKHARLISRRSGSYGAVLFIDLDNFKRLNDTAGHHVGDKLLQRVAARLLNCVRENDTVARLGGDEFVVLLESLGEDSKAAASYAEHVGDKIRISLNQPHAQIDVKYRGTPSIGVALFSRESASVDELLKQADMAMYQAKVAGRNRLMFFDPVMQAVAVAYATLESELRLAVQERQFELYYQVQVGADGRATGAEALLRWRHPIKGWVRPDEFISMAEESRLILPIGEWVLRTACRQVAAWASRPETEHLTLAVNVSPLQLAEPDFVSQVLTALEETRADPSKIKLELTETLLASDIEEVIAKMQALRAKGVSFSLDDFGTGYSSLAYLKKMPIEQLKIDQSFVRDILVDQNDAVIAKTIIALADSMGLAVIAEGVETEEHRSVLVAQGCDAHQGYLFGYPLPVKEFELSLELKRW